MIFMPRHAVVRVEAEVAPAVREEAGVSGSATIEFGELLASSGARFGFLERFLTHSPSVYGTEGQRFESSRARYVSRELVAQRCDSGLGADV